MDAERLLEFFETKPTVVDKKDAKELQLLKGEVKFEKVEFSYDARKPTLNGVNFTVAGGSTIALVGETGSGKSTILKLLNRFYDVSAGSIQIDGQDIRDVTLSRSVMPLSLFSLALLVHKLTILPSLRDKMGVVPQDPTLFNDTLMNNVRYAKLNATDEEVHEACKLAVIHDKITTFPDGKISSLMQRRDMFAKLN
jgi:ABC-type multidrug transport system fused ATPase/permease subunit